MPNLIRVKDKDTGYDRTITESELPHGNYQVLKQDAVDPVTGDVVPPEFHEAAQASPAAKKTATTRKRAAAKKAAATPSGQQADTTKEKN